MEEDIGKQGMLFLQQQRFGKKWKRVWSVLYRESTCSISRLEFWECKDGGGTLERSDRSLRKQQESKKVIRLSDCIRVSEVEMEGCPRDCGPFLVETTEKLFVFAAEMDKLEDWTQKLCEIAFPLKWGDQGGPKRSSVQRSKVEAVDEGMEDNSLYSGGDTVRDFRVVVRRTEASERCRLKGSCVLQTDFDSLLLKDAKSGDVLYTWPYRFLRRFGRDKVTFSFEAGRRCDSGEGSFEFDTKQGNALFKAVEAAINLQRTSHPMRRTSGHQEAESAPQTRPLHQPAADPAVYSSSPPQQPRPPQARLEPPREKLLTGVKSLTLDTRTAPSRKNQVKNICSCPLLPGDSQTYSQITLVPERGGEQAEKTPLPLPPGPQPPQDSEYSLPFDTINKNLMANMLNSQKALGHGSCGVTWCDGDDEASDPLYDSIDDSVIRPTFPCRTEGSEPAYPRAEHIYDEPEGCAAMILRPECPPSLYDNPEEVKGNAWRIMGTVFDPNGHEYPYNPHVDDYAVPKRAFPKRAFPPVKTDQDVEEDSAYDNVMVKMTDRENR